MSYHLLDSKHFLELFCLELRMNEQASNQANSVNVDKLRDFPFRVKPKNCILNAL